MRSQDRAVGAVEAGALDTPVVSAAPAFGARYGQDSMMLKRDKLPSGKGSEMM